MHGDKTEGMGSEAHCSGIGSGVLSQEVLPPIPAPTPTHTPMPTPTPAIGLDELLAVVPLAIHLPRPLRRTQLQVWG